MLQEILALILIFFFLGRIGWQVWHEQIPRGQFIFWLIFWLLAGIAIIFIKDIDALVARLGFSGSGIQILLYLSVALIFYFILRLRLKIERLERDLTIVVRAAAMLAARKRQ